MAFSIRNLFGKRKQAEEQQEPQPMGMHQMLQQSDAGRPVRPGYQQISMPERATRTGEEEAAYQLGAEMGSEAILRMQGMQPEARIPGDGTGGGKRIGREEIYRAHLDLQRYRSGKYSVERRVISAQQWWKLRNWEMIQLERGIQGAQPVKSSTAWLWNCIVGKHADFMDCYPEPIILPREEGDKQEAEMLSDVIPLILQMNHFEDTYNLCKWQILQEGTEVCGVFWDKDKLNGLGDISINKVNILNLFWEPGISDIEDSRQVFYTYLMDDDELLSMYPQMEGHVGSDAVLNAEYMTDDNIPKDGKSIVVDWYYKKWENGKKVLHLCTFCNGEILFSTENEGMTDGLYDDGEYPFVMQPLFPVEGSPAGYGYIDIGKDTQTDIDTLSQAMVLNSVMNATPRHFVKKDGGVNEEEYADLSKHFVHVGGSLGEDSIRTIQTPQMSGYVMQMLQQKIDELKFVTSNTDVNNGGVPTGVTAASAIAALHEESGRSSKDSNRGNFRAYNKIIHKVISRVRQGYDVARTFRITGKSGADEQFVLFDNSGLKPQPMPNGFGLENNMRLPVFDIEVRAQRENAYTKMSQNELALQFYNMGFFLPQNADQSLMCLNMMEFKGKDELMQTVRRNGTLLDMFVKIGGIAIQMAQEKDPNLAAQLAATVQGVAGQAAAPAINAGAGGVQGAIKPGMRHAESQEDTEGLKKENPLVRKAREQSENATRPS